MKKGFNTSIGCSRKKYKSSHRLAPLTSTPIIGTNARRIKEVANKIFLKPKFQLLKLKPL